MKCKICNTKTRVKYRGLFDTRYGYPGRFSVEECPSCGFMQSSPQLNNKEILKIYSKYYPRKEISQDDLIQQKKEFLENIDLKLKNKTSCHLKTQSGNKVLDIGSGTGISLMEIEALGGEAWGIDPDINAERLAKKCNFKFHRGFLYNCPFPKKYFDLITLSQVLEHEPNPLKLIKQCKKYLKPGGRIIASVPNTGSWDRKLLGKKWIHWHIPYHLNHFNKNSFEILMSRCGLKINENETFTPDLWTLLQIASLISKPKEGRKNFVWSEKRPKRKGKQSEERPHSVSFYKKIGDFLMGKLLINRFLDKMGWGEALIFSLSA